MKTHEINIVKTHCFEVLKTNLSYFFDNKGVIIPRIITSINSEREFEEQIEFSFNDRYFIDIIPGENNDELILKGFNSLITIDQWVFDLLIMTIFNYVNSCLSCTPQFKLRITQIGVNVIQSTKNTQINEQIHYFEKFGFQVLSETINSVRVELNWNYSIIEEDILLLSGFPIKNDEVISMNYGMTG